MNPEPAKPLGSSLVLGLRSASLRHTTPGGLVDPDAAGAADVQLWGDGAVIAQLLAARNSATRRPLARVAAA